MSRAERLLRLADLLRASDATTVARLATELDVSERTLLRDLATLRERGLPIDAKVGRGGGVRLDPDRGATSVHLAISEIVALWLAARLSRDASQLPWGDAATTGLSKLLGSLPPAKAKALRALCKRVLVGPPASARTIETAGTPPPELLRLFEECFTAGVGLGFDYKDRHGATTERRRIEPHGLLVQPPVWYILARDAHKGAPRSFRMDRIARPRVLKDIRFRPDASVIHAQVPADGASRPLLG